MILTPSTRRRRLVPRWRTLSATIESRELANFKDVKPSGDLPPDLIEHIETWRREKNTINAAETVEAALVHAREPEALAAAQYLVKQDSGATPAVRDQAAEVLRRTNFQMDIPEDLQVRRETAKRVWRQRTRTHPTDALSWIELALSQVSAYADDSAERSIRVALQLAPTNRHVLRSAARFYLHKHDSRRAHDLVRRSEATPHDPWLMAAEISLAAEADRSPAFSKKGMALLDADKHRPGDITELAGALGTLYLGDRRRARRLFSKSVVDPTGNALAQAEWASHQFGESFVSTEQLILARDAKEAVAANDYHVGNFDGSLDAAKKWIDEEPFSVAPYRAAAAAACILEHYDLAKMFSELGLKHDREAIDLANTRAFSLACSGNLTEAEAVLRSITPDKANALGMSVAEANKGLISFRRGNHLAGFTHYRNAMLGFRREHSVELENIAFAYMVREAALSQAPGTEMLLVEAKKKLTRLPRANLKRILLSAEKAMADRAA